MTKVEFLPRWWGHSALGAEIVLVTRAGFPGLVQMRQACARSRCRPTEFKGRWRLIWTLEVREGGDRGGHIDGLREHIRVVQDR